MKIKVQCPCETRFEFEVEPVNGRMPVSINCPTCGADATALANAIIAQNLSAAPHAHSAAPRIHVAPAAPPPPAPPSAAKLSISKPHAAAAPAAPAESASGELEAEAPASQPCPRHKSEMSVEVCCVCGKPICLKCMEQFGYVCSVYCRQQATAKRIYVPVYANQKTVVAGKSHAIAKRITAAVTVLVIALLGFWFWYAWFARNPKVVYKLNLPKPDIFAKKAAPPAGFYQLIGPGQLLTVKDKRLSIFDYIQQKELWSAALQSDAEAAAIKAARDQNEEIIKRTPKVHDGHGFDITEYHGLDPLGDIEDYEFSNPTVIATTNDVWVSFYNHLLRFDRQTGSAKPVEIKGKIASITPADDAILIVSGTPATGQTLTEITLPDGNLQSEVLTAAPATNAVPAKAGDKISDKAADKKTIAKAKPGKSAPAVDKVPVGGIKNLPTAPAPVEPIDPDTDDSFGGFSEYGNSPYIVAGPNVVEFNSKLLEHKTASHAAMKAKGKSVLESDNLTASQGLDVAQEMMNDSQRQMTGGVQTEDVSTYQVTLHRRFGAAIPDWTGEVTGPPHLYPLKTVDVLCAGQSIYVFDKNNKKLWDAKLAFSVAPPSSGKEGPFVPCLETKDSLYFSDLGILTRYDLATGNVRWRYNSVGISKIVTDPRGGIYIASTTAGPESIQYSQQVNIRDKIHPLIIKLDPATGKVLWRISSLGDTCYISGKFLYTTMVATTMAALHLEDGPDTHFYLNLLSPSDGGEIWGIHHGNQHIIKTEFQKNWILLQFQDEVVVMKFFSL